MTDARATHELRFSAESLIRAAREQTGLVDLDDDGLGERIDLLAEHLHAHLDAEGLVRAAEVGRNLLVQRLLFFADRKRYPIEQERIERPIIAFGEARSGTTVLQMLLGRDPSSRMLEFWEAMYPSPPPGNSNPGGRQALADDEWREILARIPKWLISHPYNDMLGRNPPECERLWGFDFRTMNTTTWWRVPYPGYQVQLPQDPDRQYAIHRRMLQHLQYERPEKRWVLKGILHQHRLKAVLDTYPDAICVWIHRDPIEAIASRFELQSQIYEGIGGPFDRQVFAKATVDRCVHNFRSAASDPLAEDPRIHHLTYRSFVSDPVSSIRALYAREGLEYTDEFEAAMGTWMEENPSGRYGKFTYSVEEAIGDDLPAVQDATAPYRERFGLADGRPVR